MKGPRASAAAANFSARLRAIMKKKGLNQSQVAVAMNGREISSEGKNVAKGRDRVHDWFHGLGLPNHDNLILLAKALDVEPRELLPEPEQHQRAPDILMWVGDDGHHVRIPTGPYPAEIAFEITQLARKGLT